MTMKTPCRGCEDRTPSCHGECQKYLEFASVVKQLKNDAKKKQNPEAKDFLMCNPAKNTRIRREKK